MSGQDSSLTPITPGSSGAAPAREVSGLGAPGAASVSGGLLSPLGRNQGRPGRADLARTCS